MAKDLQPIIDRMTKAETIEDGAIIFIEGVPKLIQDAKDAVLENGATAEQLVPLDDLSAALEVKSDALQKALTTIP
jgi:hypothetical protein